MVGGFFLLDCRTRDEAMFGRLAEICGELDCRTRDEAIEWARRFPAPHGAQAEGEIDVRPIHQLDATIVTWSMEGRANFVSKLMQVFFSMDKMIGRDFAAGLANLAALVEKR